MPIKLNKVGLEYNRDSKLKQIDIMKQLTGLQPLAYSLPQAHLVASLPFIDEQYAEQVPRSKVNYLIRAMQQEMQADPQQYIASLTLPTLSFADTEKFQEEVQRVKAGLELRQKAKAEGKPRRKEAGFTDPPKRLVSTQTKTVAPILTNNIIAFQTAITKSVNLQLCKKFGPLVLKELMEVLDRERTNLSQKIQAQRRGIQALNQNRKYLQTQSFQRQNDIQQRIKIMLNKRRKVE